MDPDKTPSYSASDPDPSCLRLGYYASKYLNVVELNYIDGVWYGLHVGTLQWDYTKVVELVLSANMNGCFSLIHTPRQLQDATDRYSFRSVVLQLNYII